MQEHEAALYPGQHSGTFYSETAGVMDSDQFQQAATVRISVPAGE